MTYSTAWGEDQWRSNYSLNKQKNDNILKAKLWFDVEKIMHFLYLLESKQFINVVKAYLDLSLLWGNMKRAGICEKWQYFIYKIFSGKKKKTSLICNIKNPSLRLDQTLMVSLYKWWYLAVRGRCSLPRVEKWWQYLAIRHTDVHVCISCLKLDFQIFYTHMETKK